MQLIGGTAIASSIAAGARALLDHLGYRFRQLVRRLWFLPAAFSAVAVLTVTVAYYSEAGRLVLFFVTLGVVAVVVWALIRWIGRISTIGLTTETIALVERATRQALQRLSETPNYGCLPRTGPLPQGIEVASPRTGYLQHIAIERLASEAGDREVRVHVAMLPGAFVAKGDVLATLDGAAGEEALSTVSAAFTVGDERTFEFDPRYGMTVLGEIAARALSPAINDSGTAIDVATAQARLLIDATGAFAAVEQPDHRRITVPPTSANTLIEAGFRPIARDGAARIEVVLHLIAALRMLARLPALADCAEAMAQEVAARSLGP